MIKVISFTICPFVQRVTARLEAQNLPYQVEYISLRNKPQWFLDISPNGQVPVMVTEEGVSLFESDAIVEYLDDRYGAIEPNRSPEEKALDRAWSYLASKHYLTQCSTMRSADQETYETRVAKLTKAFATLEPQVQGPFFKGENISNVDIAWLPLLHRSHLVLKHSCVDMLAGFAKLQGMRAALLSLSETTVADDFIQKFSGFYLSDTTYLGDVKKADELPAAKVSCARSSCCG